MALTKLGTPTMVGQYSLAIAITTPIMLLTGLNLRGFLVTDARGAYNYEEYFGLRSFTAFLTLPFILLVLIVTGYDPVTSLVIFIFSLAKIIESLSDIIYGVQQKHERMKFIAKSLIIRGLLSLVVVTSILILTDSIIYAIIGFGLAWLLVFIFYDVFKVSDIAQFRPRFNMNKLKELFILSLPLGIVATLISYNVNIPRYFIEYYEGIDSVGHFTAISYIMTAGMMFVTSVGQAVLPRLSLYYSNGQKRSFTHLVTKTTTLGVVLGILAICLVLFIGEEVLVFLYNQQYREFSGLFLLLTIGTAISFLNTFLGVALTAARYFKSQAYLAGGNTIVSIVASYYLIKIFGIEGSAYVIILMTVIQLIGTIFIYVYLLRKFPRASLD